MARRLTTIMTRLNEFGLKIRRFLGSTPSEVILLILFLIVFNCRPQRVCQIKYFIVLHKMWMRVGANLSNLDGMGLESILLTYYTYANTRDKFSYYKYCGFEFANTVKSLYREYC